MNTPFWEKLRLASYRLIGIIFAVLIWWVVPQNTAVAANTIGQDIYLENCSSCHLPLPAQVLPTEKWQEIINNPQDHYGKQLPTSIRVRSGLIWAYLRRDSRLLNPGETMPNRVSDSRYFKALHPQVELPQPATLQTCQICHPGAKQLNYREILEDG